MYKRLVPGTLLHRIVALNISPIACLFTKKRWSDKEMPYQIENGITDSLKYLVMHDHFIKPYGDEHVLATLLTKAF